MMKIGKKKEEGDGVFVSRGEGYLYTVSREQRIRSIF